MKRVLLIFSVALMLCAGCTRSQWLDEIVAQRDEQEEVVPILEAAQEKGLTVDSAEEVERTNEYYTGNSNDEEFKRYRIVFSDKTTVEFDVLGTLNGVQRDYYEKWDLFYISEISLSSGNYVSIDLFNPAGGGYEWRISFPITATLDNPNDNPNGGENTPENNKIYYTSTDGNVVTPYATNVFGANIVSNTYENGQGVITFVGEVTSIGDEAFFDCESLASITIPEGVTSIGGLAFQGCSSLTSITIPEGVTSIGGNAFGKCTSLAEFKGKFASEEGRCLIVDGELIAFAPAGLTEYTLPDGVTSIGEYAFYDCSSLASVTIGNGVTSIGTGAFYNCSSLTSITIPDGVTSIGNWAFCECWRLASVTIGNGVTSIGVWAFSDCSSLASVYCKATTPPTGGDYIFYNNASDRKIYVPEESVEEYKTAEWWSEYADAFVPYDFEKGEEVEVEVPEPWEIYYTSTDSNVVTPYVTNVFGANIVSNTYENWRGVITFDGEVTSIGDEAFFDCESLASITIPEGVTSIGGLAFFYCTSLASVIIPDSVTSIGNGAFSGCSSLASITIPEGVTSIGEWAFSYCSSLASVTIPEGVTSIGVWAFSDCSSLASVYCKATTPPTAIISNSSYGWGAFSSNASGRKIYVPAESVEAYKTAEGWSEYADAIVGYNF